MDNNLKQETLVEDAKDCLKQNSLPLEGDFAEGYITGSLFGSKWEQEQNKNKFNEEEVKHIVSEALQSALVKVDLEQWFKQQIKK